MAITATKINGPATIAKLGTVTEYELTIGATGWLAAGNAIDLTADYSEITSVQLGGSAEIIAGYKFSTIIPGDGVALTASNFKVTGHLSSATAIAMTAIGDGVDLSTIVGLRMTVTGKVAATAY